MILAKQQVNLLGYLGAIGTTGEGVDGYLFGACGDSFHFYPDYPEWENITTVVANKLREIVKMLRE